MFHPPANYAERLAGKSQKAANAYLATLTTCELAELVAESQHIIDEETQRTTISKTRPSWTACAYQELIDHANGLLAHKTKSHKANTP